MTPRMAATLVALIWLRAEPATACVCGHPRVSVTQTTGKVFIFEQRVPEAWPGASVELRTLDGTVLGATLTDADGSFSLPTPAPGEYVIRVTGGLLARDGFHVRVKKRRWGRARQLAIHADIVTKDCPCGAAYGVRTSGPAPTLVSADELLRRSR